MEVGIGARELPPCTHSERNRLCFASSWRHRPFTFVRGDSQLGSGFSYVNTTSIREGGSPRRVKAALKFVFATLLVAAAFVATYTSSAAAFSESDLRSILVLGGTVNTVLLLGTLFSPARGRVANAVLSLIVLASVATAYIIHTDLYLTGNGAVLIALCAGSGAGLFVAFRVIDEQRWGGIALSAAALLGLGIIASEHPEAGDVPATVDTTYIRHISFRETPNLYFVSFDALAPRALLKKYLDLETTKFHDLFDISFRRFTNFFANSVRTTHSLNTVLALDVDAYSSQRRQLNARGYDPDPQLFSGRNPSNLLGILHGNGYETTSIYRDSYFGDEKGQHINNYITFYDKTVCNLLDAGIRDFSFWGYCRFLVGEGVNRLEASALSAERITKVNADDKPQFVMAHLYAPGHTGKSFRYDDAEQIEAFRRRYINSSERAASYLDLIIRHLEKNDPGAILLVYSDHGPFLSQGLQFEDDPEFVFQDQFGILGGVYPRDTCAGWFDEASSQGHMTILDAVHALLRCLSGGESPLIKPKEYTVPWNYQFHRHDGLTYEDFLYE